MYHFGNTSRTAIIIAIIRKKVSISTNNICPDVRSKADQFTCPDKEVVDMLMF